jgi:hypothetical protein
MEARDRHVGPWVAALAISVLALAAAIYLGVGT